MKILKFFFPLILLLPFSFCHNAEKTEESPVEDQSTKTAVLETKLNAQNVFNSMPDRKEILKLIEEHKIDYNSDLLSDPTMVSKYTFESAKAANLGIYGSDLSIASSFEQTQESMVFLKCVNILAGDLGVNNAFDQRMFDRMEANKQIKDSTLEIITGSFKTADEILKANNRPATSAIVLAGAWIEGLYVSCQIAKGLGNSEDVIKSILGQRESLKNLIVLLDASQIDAGSQYILTDLKILLENFKTAEASKKLNMEGIKDISATIEVLRKKIVSGK